MSIKNSKLLYLALKSLELEIGPWIVIPTRNKMELGQNYVIKQ